MKKLYIVVRASENSEYSPVINSVWKNKDKAERRARELEEGRLRMGGHPDVHKWLVYGTKLHE